MFVLENQLHYLLAGAWGQVINLFAVQIPNLQRGDHHTGSFY